MTTSDRRRVVVTGMGAVTPLGNDVGHVLVAAGGRRVRRAAPSRAFDPSRRDQHASPARCTTSTRRRARPQGDPAQRPDDADRARRHARGDGPGRPAGAAGGRAGRADRRHHRLRPGRHGHAHRPDRASTPTRGPDRISPFFIPMAIANMAAGQVAISFGAHGPQLRDGQRLRQRPATPSARRPRRSCAATPR